MKITTNEKLADWVLATVTITADAMDLDPDVLADYLHNLKTFQAALGFGMIQISDKKFDMMEHAQALIKHVVETEATMLTLMNKIADGTITKEDLMSSQDFVQENLEVVQDLGALLSQTE